MANGEWRMANRESSSTHYSLLTTRYYSLLAIRYSLFAWSIAMKKWNMIIDVAECTNCNLCTLATMDEYVGNEWPGYTKPMPRHGHKWINILQKEGGQIPMIDLAYVPTMCNHCDDAPCVAKAGGAINKRPDG